MLTCGCRCPTICGEACPEPRYCQNCGPAAVRSQEVEFLEFSEYQEVPLDQDPVIVLKCGHIFTVSTLDGLMHMSEYYTMDHDDKPVSIKITNTMSLSSETLPSCPNCRGSLRYVARYGRIVRRALLNESTKKFISWARKGYAEIAQRLLAEREALCKNIDNAKLRNRGMHLIGDRDNQILTIKRTQGHERYGSMFNARRVLLEYLAKVQEAEQPIQRVRDMVEAVRRRKAGDGTLLSPFDFDQSVLQTGVGLRGLALLLRCDLDIFSDVLLVREKTPRKAHAKDESLKVDFSMNRTDCEKLIQDAQISKHEPLMAESHVLWARFAALELSAPQSVADATEEETTTLNDQLKQLAFIHLDAAEVLCEAHRNQTRAFAHEIEDTRKMLNNGVHYLPVTSDEMRAVLTAMARDMGGTGTWYHCVNGHPFAVGECGGPMQMARCPECNAPVGGLHHQAAEGVTRAQDINEAMRNMEIR